MRGVRIDKKRKLIHGLFAMPYQSSLAIANEFLRRAEREGRFLTHMHLQKLVYLAHGWGLAVTGKPLIEDRFEAWDYGPVIRKLYDALRYYGSGVVTRTIRHGDDIAFGSSPGAEHVAELLPNEKAIIDKVWDQYKGFEAFQLSALTHADNSPWSQTFASGSGKSRAIRDNLIWDYFADLAAAYG